MADTWDIDTTDTVSAISGMADVLDQAADAVAVSTGISSSNVTSTPIGEGDAVNLNVGPSETEGTINQGGGSVSPSVDPTMGGGPSEDTMPQSIYGTPGGEAPDVTNLGDRPSLGQLQAALESGVTPAVGDPTMGGGPSDLINLMGEEEVAEEVAPGEQVATFLSDFNRSMSAQSPEQGLVAKIDALQDQAASLQAMVAGGPVRGGGPQDQIGGGPGYGSAWPGQAVDPAVTRGTGFAGMNTTAFRSELDRISSGYDAINQGITDERTQMDMRANPGAYRTGGPSDVMGSYSYSPNVGDTVASEAEAANLNAINRGDPNALRAAGITPIASGGGQNWVNPNLGDTVASPDEAAMLNAINRGDPAALRAAGIAPVESMVTETSLPATPSGTTDEFFGGQWFAEEGVPSTRQDRLIAEGKLPDLRFLPDKFEDITAEQMALMEKTASDWYSTQIAPKYSGETTGYQTHEQMYPDHRNKAAMAGVASIKSMFDGTHKAWIQAINQDMKDREIVLDHAINGVKTGKHSSGNWKEYNDLFTVGEDGVPRDSDGVAMPGTEKQAQAGIGGVLQGLWGGVLSGAQNFFQPRTSSGVVEEPLLETGANTLGADYDRPEPTRVVGDDTRGDNPIDIIRSTYAWAASLPNNVLFNAARYPDYLRLLIEYDAAGKDLPLTVPTWILEGTTRPAEDDEEESNTASWISSHPSMQTQELTWT